MKPETPKSDNKTILQQQAFIDEQRRRIAILQKQVENLEHSLASKDLPEPPSPHLAETAMPAENQLELYAGDFQTLLYATRKTEQENQVAFERLKAELDVSRKTSVEQQQAMLRHLISLLTERYPFMSSQLIRSKVWARAIGERLGWTTAKLNDLETLVDVIDIGMLALPDGIFAEGGRPVAASWDAIVRHPALSAQMVAYTEIGRNYASVITHHHERFDGHGFPNGLAGTDIPIESRLLMVVNAYVAMTSYRPYRSPMAPLSARAEIKQGRDAAYDPRIVDVFLDFFATYSVADQIPGVEVHT